MSPILAVMVGISGSGKSTYANGLKTSLSLENGKNTELVETDAIRLELTGNAEDQTQNGRVFSIARSRVTDFLKQDKNVVIDATSPTKRDRREWLDIGRKASAEVRAYFVEVTPEVAKARNAKRDRKVPDFVIDKQLAKLTPPQKEEGFSKVVVIKA